MKLWGVALGKLFIAYNCFVCSFYLQLGLLQQECSAFTASCVAASALSNALEMFGQPAWSPALQHYSAYSLQDLLPCKNSLISAQTDIAADHLRRIWRSYHELHDYVQYKVEWDRVLTLMTCQGKLAWFALLLWSKSSFFVRIFLLSPGFVLCWFLRLSAI